MENNFEYLPNQPKSAKELVAEFEQEEKLEPGELIKFEGFHDKDVYNITAPFVVNEKVYIAGRVEPRDKEYDSKIHFFQQNNEGWVADTTIPPLDLQDPLIAKYGKGFVLGGVKVIAPDEAESDIQYRTEFLLSADLEKFTKFAEGPLRMKDIRILPLSESNEDEIAVFTRPQGEIGGRGKIGFTIVSGLEALATTDFLKSKIIEGQFKDEEWGGVNELHLLDDGRIGVLGHIAYFDEDNKKHYYAMSFIFDPKTEEATPIRVIATRKNFPAAPAKRPELEDIIFPGGLVQNSDGTATLYVGLSDTSAGKITIPNPFIR